MGQSASLEAKAGDNLTEEFDFLHDQIRKHSFTLRQLTLLTYDDLHNKIAELNALSSKYVDCNGKQLLFEVKPGSDSHVLWKGTVKIICVKIDPGTQKIEKSRELHLKQFLQVYNTMQIHLNASHTSKKSANSQVLNPKDDIGEGEDGDGKTTTTTKDEVNECSSDMKNVGPRSSSSSSSSVPTTSRLHVSPMNASILLDTVTSSPEEDPNADDSYDRDECCICMESKPEVSLPCTHSYCLACIEQWNVLHNTCPICRGGFENTDESWVLEELPNPQDVKNEIQKTLFDLTR